MGRQNKVQGRWSGSSFAETTNLTYYGNTDFVHTSETGGVTVTYTYQWNPTAKTRTEIVTDELGKKTYTMYDAKGQVWRVWGSASQPVEYEYDSVGRQTKMKTYRSGSFTGSSWPTSGVVAATTTWDWEEATGLLLSKTTAESEAVSFTYKPLGEVHTKTLARGAVTTYSYYDESAGTASGSVSHLTRELRQVDYSYDSNLTPSVRYTYNRLGQLATVITDFDGDGAFESAETRTLSYRSDMQLNSESLESSVYGSNRSLVSTYEVDGTNTVNGRNNGYQFKSGSNVQASATYGFDGYNRLVTVAPHSGQTMHYAYAPGSDWVSQVTAGPSASAKYKRSNTLLSNRAVVDQVSTTWNGAARGSYDSAFDSTRGLRASVAQSGGGSSSAVITNFTTTYTYNDRRELIDADNSYSATRDYEWVYDLMGKRSTAKVNTSTTTYNPVSSASADVNEYASITGHNAESGLTYDDDGNMTKDATWDYEYDAENRLVRMIRKTESSGSIPDRLEFKYDYLGRRVQKTVYDHQTSGSVLSNTSYVWNGWSLVAELNAASSHALLRSYLWGKDFSTGGESAGGAGGLLSVTQGSTVYYPVYDPMGNVTGYVTDNTLGTGSGAIAARYEYNAYGERQNGSGSESAFAFGFATQFKDHETGLIYYGYRYYNPKHGRFINRDPIGEQGGRNLYSFVGNNPAMGHDVLGLCNFDMADAMEYDEEHDQWVVIWGSEAAKAECDRKADREGGLVWDGSLEGGDRHLGWDGDSYVIMDSDRRIKYDFGAGNSVTIGWNDSAQREVIWELEPFIVRGEREMTGQALEDYLRRRETAQIESGMRSARAMQSSLEARWAEEARMRSNLARNFGASVIGATQAGMNDAGWYSLTVVTSIGTGGVGGAVARNSGKFLWKSRVAGRWLSFKGFQGYRGLQGARAAYEVGKTRYLKHIAGVISLEGLTKGLSGIAPNPGDMAPSKYAVFGIPMEIRNIGIPAQAIGYGVYKLFDDD